MEGGAMQYNVMEEVDPVFTTAQVKIGLSGSNQSVCMQPLKRLFTGNPPHRKRNPAENLP